MHTKSQKFNLGRLMTLTALAASLVFLVSCSALGLSSEDDDNTVELLGLALLTNSPCTSGVTNNDSSLPDYIKNNFQNMTITDNGTSYVFKTNDLPPYSNGYYSQLTTCYINDFPSGNHANPNTISSQGLTLTIPKTPDTGGSTTDYGAVGVAIDGSAIYNSEAAPGDSLATELATMNAGNGHPTDIGQYHYHTEPYKISNDDSNLVGIALDGYLIFGKKERGGTYASGLDANGGHSTTNNNFWGGSSVYHYHVANTSDGLIIIANYHGTAGTVSQ